MAVREIGLSEYLENAGNVVKKGPVTVCDNCLAGLVPAAVVR
jgi:hypothetical protein